MWTAAAPGYTSRNIRGETNYEKLFYDSAYIRTFEAKVLSCEKGKKGYEVALDQTAFYPEGGGQPYDTGILGGAHVTAVHDVKGEIVHYTDAPLAVGETVTGEIELGQKIPEYAGTFRRTSCVRADCTRSMGMTMWDSIWGLRRSPSISMACRVEDLMEIEKKANRIIWEDREIYAGFPSC